MEKQITLNELGNYIDEESFLVVGSPQGVGFSTYIAEYIAYNMFFKESFYALVLTDNRRDKTTMGYYLKKAFTYYEYPLEHDIEGGIHHLYTKGEDGGGLCVINYDEFPINKIISAYEEGEVDLLVIDNDDFSNYLYSNIEDLKGICKKFVFNTYDLPHSIIFNSDGAKASKVILTSPYSKKNIDKNYGRYPNRINYDRILLGEFKI